MQIGGLPNSGSSSSNRSSKGNYISLKDDEKIDLGKNKEENYKNNLSDDAKFLYNQIISNAGLLSDFKAKMMIDKNEYITDEEKKLIKELLGV